MARYYHTFPAYTKKRQNYSILFNEEDKARLAYNRDLRFQSYANRLHSEMPELSLKALYNAYKSGTPIQLSLSLS